MDLIRILITGNVDDGKSTLIGRLLLDSQSLATDQIETIQKQSKDGIVDLAYFTDGLADERFYQKTIDIGYRYFGIAGRKFIIADAPGHIEFTQNMITAASLAELCVVLVDVTRDIREQTKRHLKICDLVGVKSIVFCVNKIDLIDYEELKFKIVVEQLQHLLAHFSFTSVTYIPVSGVHGDNVVTKSVKTLWYFGGTLLDYLRSYKKVTAFPFNKQKRFVIQHVNSCILPSGKVQHRYAGKVKTGNFRIDEQVRLMPADKLEVIKDIEGGTASNGAISADQLALISFQAESLYQRGDIVTGAEEVGCMTKHFRADLIWFGPILRRESENLLLQYQGIFLPFIISKFIHKAELDSMNNLELPDKVLTNDIAFVEISLEKEIFVETYDRLMLSGCFAVIDSVGKSSLGVGIVRELL